MLVSFCSPCREIGVKRGTHKLKGEGSCSAVVFRCGLGKPLEKNSNLPHLRVPRPPVVKAAWLEQEASGALSWGGSQMCYTRAPSASWHGGLAGEPVARSWGKGHRTLSTPSQWGRGPGRREILSSKLDRILTSGTIAGAGRGDADFPRALHVNPPHQIQPPGA